MLRNALLLGIAVSGSVASLVEPHDRQVPGVAVAACAGLVAGLVVLRWDDIVELFRDIPELAKE